MKRFHPAVVMTLNRFSKKSAGLLVVVLLSAATAAYGQVSTVGLSIACSNDHVYTWYVDRTVRLHRERRSNPVYGSREPGPHGEVR